MPLHHPHEKTVTGPLQSLLEMVDARLGLPITTHRTDWLGQVVVPAKKSFRKLFQPLINELLQKQVRFNERTVELARSIYRELHDLESFVWTSRRELEKRIEALESELAKLRSEVPAQVNGKSAVNVSSKASSN